MKKVFTTILMLCVALVGMALPPGQEPNALSIPSDGWNASTGELTVYHSGVGKAGPAEWEAILNEKGISQGSVTKLNLTGFFDNKAIKEATGNGVLSKLTNTTLYLDLSGCEAAYCEMTGIAADGKSFTYKPSQGNPVTLEEEVSYEGLIKSTNTTHTLTSTFNNATFSIPAPSPFNAGTYPNVKAQQIDNQWNTPEGTLVISGNSETGYTITFSPDGYNYYQVTDVTGTETVYTDPATGQVVDTTTGGTLVENADGTYNYTYTLTTTINDKFELNKDGKSKINGITFPDNEHFTYIPESLCTGQNPDDKWTALTTLVFPNNIVAIGPKAFLGASALANITWSTGLQYIGLDNTEENVGPFQECTSLATVNLSNTSVEVIGKDAFNATTNINLQSSTGNLTSVIFPTTLKVIGGEAFHCTKVTTVSLAECTKLEKIGYEAFENCTQLASVSFPGKHTETVEGVTTETYYLTYFGNDAFKNTALVTVDMSMCEGITEFQHFGRNGANEYLQFGNCTSLTSITFPPNLAELYGGSSSPVYGCTSLTTVIFPGTAKYRTETVETQVDGQTVTTTKKVLANPLVIKEFAFGSMASLTTLVFADNSNLQTIETNAFKETSLTEANLSTCHELRTIENLAFNNIDAMTSVTLCSHPKTIKGGEGVGAFMDCEYIRRVEVIACDGVTDVTQCVCENRAFDPRITYHQTDATLQNIQTDCAVLIFPDNAAVPSTSPYTSGFDYFVGDYKAKSLIYQESLQGLFKDVPQEGEGQNKIYDLEKFPESQGEGFVTVQVPYQKGNGWHEFIQTDLNNIIPLGEFLRTYSRSIGAGPCILPKGITAYRAVDYQTQDRAYVKDNKGDYVLIDPAHPENKANYKKISDLTDEEKEQYENNPKYSYLTVGGKVYLRPLVAYQANVSNIPYSDDVYSEDVNLPKEEQRTNKDFYDNLVYNIKNIPSDQQPASANVSYVPEETGVVLYSYNQDEAALLILGGYFGTETVLPKYKHTGDRYETVRQATDPDNINMLQGTFDVKTLVAPVFPWFGADPDTGLGGGYSDKEGRQYRNFSFDKSQNLWRRLKPGKAKDNFAFASIPAGCFDNFNEQTTQSPNFTREDLTGSTTTSTNLMLVSFFEGVDNGAADGIKTVNTVIVNSDSNAWYTLQGVRVAQPTKGVYIHNGKKVVIK